MGTGLGHTHRFFVHTESGVHRLAPECKLAATLLFVFAVVATPTEAFWAFGVHAAIIMAVAIGARVPLLRLARRLTIELPFVAFALMLPFLAGGEQVSVGFLSLSVAGLWGMWNVLIKATLGVAASSLLIATTSVPDMLVAMRRLRVPRTLVAIASFMIRYGEVLADELRRMRIARLSRGDDPRWLWQVRGLAQMAGVLFVRAYERGERVYVSMLARGFGGAMPIVQVPWEHPTLARGWLRALTAPLLATAVCVTAVVAR